MKIWEIHLNWKFRYINECIWIIGENVFLSCVLTQSTSTREHRESNNGWCCSWSRSGPSRLGFSCSTTTTTKLSQRRSSSSKTTRRCCVKMAVSLDEKKKNYTLQKSEEAFAAAKVQLITIEHLACVVLVIGFDSKFELGSLNFEFNFCMYWLLKKFDCSEFGSPISVTFGLIMMGFMWYWLYGLCYMMEVARMFYWYCKMTVI